MSRIKAQQFSNVPNDKKVTIGLCVKNGGATLGAAIESVLAQTYPHENLEIIFVDDGSNDNTLTIIESYIPKMDISVRVFRNDWRGLGESRDLIVDSAAGDYIVWVDCDMTLSPDFVAKQVSFMEENPNVGLAKGQYGVCPQESLAGYLENIEFVAAHLRRRQKPNSLPLGTGGSIYRVKAIRQAGGFDHELRGSGEDADAEYRIRKAGWSLAATSPVFYEKRRGGWRELWTEYFWLGKNVSNLSEDEKFQTNISRLWPPMLILVELSRIGTAYKLTLCKKVFLLPFHYLFKRVAWVLGFVGLLISG